MWTFLATIRFKWRRAVARGGLRGAVAHAARKAWRVLRDLHPRRQYWARVLRRRSADFDRAHGIETAAEVELSDLEVLGRRELGTTYIPSNEEVFLRAMGSVPCGDYSVA